MSIVLPKVIPGKASNVAIAQKYFWNQSSGNAFRARLQSLQEKSLELLESRTSFVTNRDIIQRIWHLSMSINHFRPQRRNGHSC